MSALDASTAAPRHASGVVLRQDGGGDRLVDREGTTVHVLNATALALWELCDGETTAEEMELAICALFDVAASTAHDDIRTTLDQLTGQGLLSWPTTRGV